MFVVNLCLVWCFLCAKSCVNKKKVNNFSHTTGSHAKPNHTAWPLFIQQNVTKQYKKTNGYTHYKLKHLKRAIVRPHKGFTTKKKGETRGIKRKKLTSLQRVGGREVRLKERQQENWKTTRIMWPRPPAHTSTQAPRCVWEKRFPLHSFLSQQKTTLIMSAKICL